MGHDLLYELAKDGEEHEDREHLILELLLGGACVEEGKSDEEGLESQRCTIDKD